MRKHKSEKRKTGVIRVMLLLQFICFIEVTCILKMTLLDTGAYNEYKAGNGEHMPFHIGNINESIDKDTFIIEMAGLSQDGIPTGCESVSTVTVLQHFGVDITPEEFIGTYLPCASFYKKDGVLYGANPHEAFAGDPFQKASLGCFPQVIIKALRNMAACQYEGMEHIMFEDVSGISLGELEAEYLAQGIPVLLWITSDMKPSYAGMQYYLEDGSLYTWQANEHCMVLCGFDEEAYYFKDPQAEGETASYARELVESRYEEMGQYAVVVNCK